MLDHLIYGVPVLADGVNELEEHLGVRAQPGGKHQALGTHNALLGLGQSAYLEVIAPDPEQPVPAMPRPFGLDSLDSPRLVGWAVRCRDIDARVAQAREQGYDPGDAIELQRTTVAGAVLRSRLTLNPIGGGPIPFLIDWGDAVHPTSSAPAGLTLLSFHLEHPEPEVLTRALHALEAEVPIIQGHTPMLVARIYGRRGPAELR